MPRPPRQPDVLAMVFPIDQAVQFDPDAFDDLIRNNGVKMIHWRSMRCPVGLTDLNDARRPHEHHEDCSNGFLFTRAGVVTVSFLNNSVDSRFTDVGRLDGSTVNCSLPRNYDDQPDKTVKLVKFDRMYLDDELPGHRPLLVEDWQTFQCHATGRDRLNFPVVHVSDLVDSGGRRYYEGQDFDCRLGQIVWRGVGPGIDTKTGKGVICSVRYEYRPFWYVKNMIHEVRIAQIEDESTGDRTLNRMPQSCVLQREHTFHTEERDPDAPNLSGRQQPQAPSGRFGAK